ncbi:MAG: phosphoribosylformylglycinamidine synthase subunit PurL, partial [Candidatus Aminicenantes bacterium]|nr:phosphoribosylformylglycinamidine synthase subunit PurL [Candidatus Aminicenantes bacterium]
MWSEHCSYKNSKRLLRTLPTTGKAILQGPGENAGIVDIGDEYAIAFKIESHNHPSYIEPFQGAATGVGGILRDIFTMGARPIALLDSLRFGPLSLPKNRAIMEGVVAGISAYGNSVGVPTVGGEAFFHKSYSHNPLVNVFCLGLAQKEKIFYARAGSPGNAVIYVGAKTGRDGIHGATMASAEFDSQVEKKRPNVQVGDPFKEKLLIEACLEVMEKNLIVGIQDMGAAGLTCSTTEIAAKSGTGICINLDLIPQREEGMTPYEIMLSESQERMLLIAQPEKVAAIQEIFARWDLDAVVIGEITSGQNLEVFFHGEKVVDVPVEAVVNLCPVYDRPKCRPAYQEELYEYDLKSLELIDDFNESLIYLLAHPNIACKEWIYRQYDHMVQINTVLLPGADAAVLRIKGTDKFLAISLDGNGLYCYLDPKRGSKIAVAEACRNLACVGAYPLGITNCLNFGNPEKPEIMWQFAEVVAGMAEACRHFDVPVTGGNVSFYNETEGKPVLPTPVIGAVGLIEGRECICSPGFKMEGDIIGLAGLNKEELGGSLYLQVRYGLEKGWPPEIDLEAEKKLHHFTLKAIKYGLVQSAHDISEGGLAVALAESSFLSPGRFGFEINLDESIRSDALLFGETQSRIIFSLKKEKLNELTSLAKETGVPFKVIGRVGGKKIKISHLNQLLIELDVDEAFKAWKNSLENLMRIG